MNKPAPISNKALLLLTTKQLKANKFLVKAGKVTGLYCLNDFLDTKVIVVILQKEQARNYGGAILVSGIKKV